MKTIEVVAAIIHKDNCYLATQRGYGDFEGMWEFPGGKIEEGESREEALKREIKEELDVEVKIEKFLCIVNYDYPNFHLTMHCYHCSIGDSEIRLLEHQSAKWLTKDELNEVEWLPADIAVIERLCDTKLHG